MATCRYSHRYTQRLPLWTCTRAQPYSQQLSNLVYRPISLNGELSVVEGVARVSFGEHGSEELDVDGKGVGRIKSEEQCARL